MIENLLRPQHLLIIFGVYMLFFGAKKLPEMAKGLGEGIREFKKTFHEANESAEELKKS